jgi:hypothetical protein
MKKNVVISGSLADMVTYCTAVYDVEGSVETEKIEGIVSQSPIFEDKNFYTNVLGHVSKTTVTRKTKVFFHGSVITLQIRYELIKVVDIELTEKDEVWIKNDINKLLEHFELLLGPFVNVKDDQSESSVTGRSD